MTIFPKSNGRPPFDEEIIKLIIKLKKLNPAWGAQRISDELMKIGYKVSKPTVLKYLEINGLNNPTPYKGLNWSEFLSNHKFKITIDFTSLIDISQIATFYFCYSEFFNKRVNQFFLKKQCNLFPT